MDGKPKLALVHGEIRGKQRRKEGELGVVVVLTRNSTPMTSTYDNETGIHTTTTSSTSTTPGLPAPALGSEFLGTQYRIKRPPPDIYILARY